MNTNKQSHDESYINGSQQCSFAFLIHLLDSIKGAGVKELFDFKVKFRELKFHY
jgi:hypothetical protein